MRLLISLQIIDVNDIFSSVKEIGLHMLLLIVIEAATPAESARSEDPGLSLAREAAEEHRLRMPHRVATSVKPTSCWPPRKASGEMEISIFLSVI